MRSWQKLWRTTELSVMSREICKDKTLCTGCTACANICPKSCISMVTDTEGFKYPKIAELQCVNCGFCEKICPVNNPPVIESVKEAYVARYKDLEIVDNSTSGGSYSAFADYTFAKGGLLYGVGYDTDMRVRHFSIDSSEKDRIAEMRGSKYVQSDLDVSFKEIKSELVAGRFVCFSGTPCQVAGLKAYLKKDYENLITVDLVCHGVASPLFFKKYVEYQAGKYKSRPKDIRFRNKTYGYHSGTMMVKFENGKKYYGSGRIDYMLKAYFKGACSRYSCYQCPFKGVSRCSDFTVFDSWHIGQLVSGQVDDDRGYTNIFVHTDKGRTVLQEIASSFTIWQADADNMKNLDGVMIDNNPKMHSCRGNLIDEIAQGSFEAAMQKSLPVSFKDHVLEKVKAVSYRIGVLKFVKK